MLNYVAKNLTGWIGDSAIEKPFAEVFEIINESSREICDDPIKKALDAGKVIGLSNHTILISKDGTERSIADSAAPIFDAKGLVIGAVIVFQDITSERTKQKEIEFLSYHDQLTGLYNRRFYEEELKRLDTKRNFPLTIVIGDVNGLKLVNDSFGHVKGDELLKKTAEVIKKGCRADDIIARLGGDEFVIILPITDAFKAEQIINRINDLSLKEKAGAIDISISFGYKTKMDEEEKIQEIFKFAEDQMYRNKRLGRK